MTAHMARCSAFEYILHRNHCYPQRKFTATMVVEYMKRSILSLPHFALEQLPHVLNNKKVEGTQGNRKERNDVGINQQPGYLDQVTTPLPSTRQHRTAVLVVCRYHPVVSSSGIILNKFVRGRRERSRARKPGKASRWTDAEGFGLTEGETLPLALLFQRPS